MRDFLLPLLTYLHGLPASLAARVRRQDLSLNLDGARAWIRQFENVLSIEHSIAGDELGAFKRYLHIRHGASPWLFVSEHGQPMNRRQHSGQQLPHAGAPGDVALHAGIGGRKMTGKEE